uniref:Uncharacterized protein n=1 Tax=Arundo donax TaxID=35708 RepID=A0A0A8ZR92_ARUDO
MSPAFCHYHSHCSN